MIGVSSFMVLKGSYATPEAVQKDVWWSLRLVVNLTGSKKTVTRLYITVVECPFDVAG